MMTPKEAFALVNGYLTSNRCQFQGLNEAASISQAMMVLNPEGKSELPPPKNADQINVDAQLEKLATNRNNRRKNEDAKTESANNRSAP